jgi:hypothetical protein
LWFFIVSFYYIFSNLLVLLLFSSTNQTNIRIGESCDQACSRHDLKCNWNSLKAADEYLTFDTMNSTMTELGESCRSFYDNGTTHSGRPSIRWSDGKCYPKKVDGGSYNPSCSRIVAADKSRICGCWYTPSASPTISIEPSGLPSLAPSTNPSSLPSSEPTGAPSPRPTLGNIEDIDETSPVLLDVSSEGEVRTLVKHTINPETGIEYLVPIGRSYDGSPWEGQKVSFFARVVLFSLQRS